MKKHAIFLLFSLTVMLLTAGCLRMDANLFNPSSDITEYLLDDYEQENPRVDLDASYDLPDSTYHLFTLTSDDNGDQATIWAAYIGNIDEIATDTVIMYCHGNGAHMDAYWDRCKLLANMGSKNRFGVLMVDYRGYGLSEGTPTESGMYADVDAGVQWLADNGLTGDRLVMYGFSLGTAPATELTAHPRSLDPGWLILEAPFASAEVMVQDGALLALPGSYFTDLKIDNAEEIKEVEEPFLWMHGIDDTFLAMDTHGEVVYQNYTGDRGQAVRVPGAGHSDCIPFLGYETYRDLVYEFITE